MQAQAAWDARNKTIKEHPDPVGLAISEYLADKVNITDEDYAEVERIRYSGGLTEPEPSY